MPIYKMSAKQNPDEIPSTFLTGGFRKQPGTPEFMLSPRQEQWGGKLGNLATQDIKYPTLQVPGMSANEQAGQSILGDIVAGNAFQDPRSSPYYQGLRDEINADTERGLATLNRQNQVAGMAGSSTAGRVAGDYLTGQANKKATLLGQLYESERSRDNPYTRLEAANQYGSLPRMLQTAQEAANYDASVKNLEAPYQLQSPLMQYLAEAGSYFTPQYTQEPSGLESLMSVISAVTPLIGMFMPSRGGGSSSSGAMGAAGISGGSSILSSIPLALGMAAK